MKKILLAVIILHSLCAFHAWAEAETTDATFSPSDTMFDDKILLDRYITKYHGASKEMLYAMNNVDTLTPYKSTAAICVLTKNFVNDAIAKARNFIEKLILHRLNHTDSAFIEVESMYALVVLDRYKYFKIMVPNLIK